MTPTPSPFLAADPPMPTSDAMPEMSIPQCAAAWTAALKLTAGGRSIDQAAMLKIAKAVVGTKASMMSAASLSPDALAERRAMLARHFGL